MARKDANAGSDVRRAERSAKALQLRRDGLPYRSIAALLGCGVGTVCRDIATALEAANSQIAESAAALRDRENRKLDQIEQEVRNVMEQAERSDEVPPSAVILAAVDRLLKTSAQRARLLGLNDRHQELVEIDEVRRALTDYNLSMAAIVNKFVPGELRAALAREMSAAFAAAANVRPFSEN